MRQLDIHVVRFDGSPEDAVRGLESEFGLNHEAAVRFVNSVPRLARSGTAPQEAHAYQQVLSAMGAVVELRPTRSLPTATDNNVPSLPRPPVIRSARDPAFDSSAALANRVPRAPAVPLEAWQRGPRGGFDELGYPLPNGDEEGDELVLRSWPSPPAPAPYDPFANSPTGSNRDGFGHADEELEEHVDEPTDHFGSAEAVATATTNSTEDTEHSDVEDEPARGSQRGLWLGVALLLVSVIGGLYVRWQAAAVDASPAVEQP